MGCRGDRNAFADGQRRGGTRGKNWPPTETPVISLPQLTPEFLEPEKIQLEAPQRTPTYRTPGGLTEACLCVVWAVGTHGTAHARRGTVRARSSVRLTATFHQPIDAVADRHQWKSGPSDRAWRAMIAPILPIARVSPLENPVIGRERRLSRIQTLREPQTRLR